MGYKKLLGLHTTWKKRHKFRNQKKNRKANFKEDELHIIADEVLMRKETLLNKFSDTISNEKKKREWATISEKVNAVSIQKRTGEQIKKKWQDWSSAIKVKNCKIQKEKSKTGGGSSADDLSILEQKVISILGRTAVEGIAGWEDSEQPKNTKTVEIEETDAEQTDPNDVSLNDSIETIWHTKLQQATEKTKCQEREQDVHVIEISNLSKKKPTRRNKTDTQRLIEIEEEKLKLKKETLEIKRRLLEIEEQKLNIEERILECLQGFTPSHTMRLTHKKIYILLLMFILTLVLMLRLQDKDSYVKYEPHFQDNLVDKGREQAAILVIDEFTDEIVPFAIVTVRRSGSTLLGDILQTDPNTFYIFEPFFPLAKARGQIITHQQQRYFIPRTDDHLILDKHFTCNFTKSEELFTYPYIRFSRGAKPFLYCYLMSRPEHRWNDCLHIMTNNCKRSQFRFIKTVRLPMKHLSNFMDKYPKMKIIHLIRDPRASLKGAYNYDVTKVICDKISDNIKTESDFHLQYPGRTIRVYFEEMAFDPIGTSRNLYKFIGLNFDRMVESYIYNITSSGKKADGMVGSVRPNSTKIIYEWRDKIDFQRVKEVENICSIIFENTWYVKCDNIRSLKNFSFALHGKTGF